MMCVLRAVVTVMCLLEYILVVIVRAVMIHAVMCLLLYMYMVAMAVVLVPLARTAQRGSHRRRARGASVLLELESLQSLGVSSNLTGSSARLRRPPGGTYIII